MTGLPAQTTRGNTGFYVLADQMVYREGAGKSKQGLTPFVAVLVAPDASINQMPLFVNGGLVYRGVIPRRDHDIAGFGVVYGRFSRDLRRSQQLERQAGTAAPIQDFEVALEWTYIVQMARWLDGAARRAVHHQAGRHRDHSERARGRLSGQYHVLRPEAGGPSGPWKPPPNTFR